MIGRLAAERRRLGPAKGVAPLPWRLRALPVCASTERELDRWLASLEASALHRHPNGCLDRPAAPLLPLAVLARRQRFGRGQRGRVWCSPPGGVWLSAALPWPERAADAASLALAVAVGLAQELQPLLPLNGEARLAIKWPNDLVVCRGDTAPCKLAGVLPRLRFRGDRVRLARVGVGLNGCNRVPAGAIALAELSPAGRGHLGAGRAGGASGRLGAAGRWMEGGRRPRGGSDPAGRSGGLLAPERLAARVLRGLEWAVAWAPQPDAVCELAERLWLPGPPLLLDGELWQQRGLARDGRLRLECAGRERLLERRF